MSSTAGCLLHPAPQALFSHVAIPCLVKEGGRKRMWRGRKLLERIRKWPRRQISRVMEVKIDVTSSVPFISGNANQI